MEGGLSFLAVASAMVFVSAVAQSLTGFGFALLLAPLLSLVWDPQSVVVVSTLLNATLSIGLTAHSRGDVSFSRVGVMLLGAVVGIPIGLVVLSQLDPNRLRVLIGGLVIVLGATVYWGAAWPAMPERASLLVAGLLSGSLHAGTSMGGPPAVLCLLSQGHEKTALRGTLLGFFGPLSLLTLAAFWWGGLVQPRALWTSLAVLPALVVGVVLGNAAFRWAPARLFRGLVALLVVAAGVLSVATGLRGS